MADIGGRGDLGRYGRSGMLRRPDNGAGAGGTPEPGADGNQDGGTPPELPTFDTWYASLDAPLKGLVDSHVSGLKTALTSERSERTTLSRRIGELQKVADKGSDMERQLADLQGALAATERRAAFVEEGIRPEIGCTNVKTAYALAVSDNLFDSRGRADWNAIKTAAPELFRKPGLGSVDGGAGQHQAPKLDMNTIIRRAAGRG